MAKTFKPPFYLNPDGSFTIPDEGREQGKSALGLASIHPTIAAFDAHPAQQAGADYVCDGVDDDVQIQAALDSLPIHGGKIRLSVGTFNLSAAVCGPHTDNVTIEGSGPGTFVNLDNSTPVIDVLDCDRWSVLNLTTDMGGVDILIATNFTLYYWQGGLHGPLVQHTGTDDDGPYAYTPTNVSTDRAFDANNTSIDELADVLGTVIADLKAYGLLK
jgi:hypothetical protein